MISGYWTKDMVFWERGFVFVLKGKKKRFWTPSKVIRIRFDKIENPLKISATVRRKSKGPNALVMYIVKPSIETTLKLTGTYLHLQPELELTWLISLVGYRILIR